MALFFLNIASLNLSGQRQFKFCSKIYDDLLRFYFSWLSRFEDQSLKKPKLFWENDS